MFQEGLGGPRDAVIALVWYRKAAAQGSAEGEFNAASLLERGTEGIPQDAEAAAEGYARAAKFGLPLASYRLARMLDENRAAKRGDGTAFERYLAAAQDGVAEAQAELDKPATQYRFALQLAPIAAVPWLRKAAAQNYLPAQLSLAIALEEGRGTARNPAEAFGWYIKAAAADDAEALFRLGNLYDQGIGTPADPVKSRDYYARAADLGHAGAKDRMARLVGLGSATPDFGNPFKGLR
jgi:TPR repeat protein